MLKRLKTALIALLLNLRNRVPEPLPTTDAAVADVITRAIRGAGLDEGNDSLRNAVASTLLSLREGTTSVVVADLIAVINQARCKQAAYGIIEAIRTKDKAAREEANKETTGPVESQVS